MVGKELCLVKLRHRSEWLVLDNGRFLLIMLDYWL
jgi:hypothetical protein